MGLPDRFEVWASHMTTIIAEEGPPTNNWKKEFVLKWILGNFKGLNSYFFSKKKKLTENRSTADPTHPP